MIIIKDDSVKLKKITPALALMFYVVERYHRGEAYKELQPTDLVITSINDGTHMKGSRHYTDEAFDMRSKSFKETNKEAYRKAMELELNLAYSKPNKDCFTVLLENKGKENEHFHFQVKKGVKFP